MNYSTGPKKSSRLQGHRSRRRPIVFNAADVHLQTMVRAGAMTETDYKTMRQYFNDFNREENGHHWLNNEFDQMGGNKRDIAAETGFEFSTSKDSFRHHRPGRILLREPEQCSVCGGVYLSLYTLRACQDHSVLTELYKPMEGKAPKIAPAGIPKYSEASEAEKDDYAFIGKSEIGASEDDEEAGEII